MFVERLFVSFLGFKENFDTDLLDNVNIGPLNEEINFSITQEEILRCIKKLKNNKVCGEDYVVNEYMKSTSNLFSNRAEVFWIKWIAFIFVYWFYITYKPNVGHYTRVNNCIKYHLASENLARRRTVFSHYFHFLRS
jgi:hypothetical protein